MSYFNFKNLFDFEKKSVFFINFFLILLMILIFLYEIKLKYFFYFDIFLTLILSYIFFKKSKKLSRYLIITNIFIFLYFLFPNVSYFLTELFGNQSYVFIIFYNVLIAYIFLSMSGFKNSFLGDFRKFNLKIFLTLILVAIVFGFLFYFVKEPVPSMFVDLYSGNFDRALLFLLGSSFAVAFSEQMIFTGFLFNVYKNLTTKFDASIQVSILFVMFHLLRFELLVEYYYKSFGDMYLLYIILYYIFLFVFMNACIYFYSLNTKKYKGNFFYPVIIHFVTDFSLFAFTLMNSGV